MKHSIHFYQMDSRRTFIRWILDAPTITECKFNFFF